MLSEGHSGQHVGYGIRQLDFISPQEAEELVALREELRNDWEGDGEQPSLAVLDKIIAILQRREEIPF